MDIHTPKNPPMAAPEEAPTVIASTPPNLHATKPPAIVPTKILAKNRRPPKYPTPAPKHMPINRAAGRNPIPIDNPVKTPTVPKTNPPNTTSNIFETDMARLFCFHADRTKINFYG